jgi:hypothetical protein
MGMKCGFHHSEKSTRLDQESDRLPREFMTDIEYRFGFLSGSSVAMARTRHFVRNHNSFQESPIAFAFTGIGLELFLTVVRSQKVQICHVVNDERQTRDSIENWSKTQEHLLPNISLFRDRITISHHQ